MDPTFHHALFVFLSPEWGRIEWNNRRVWRQAGWWPIHRSVDFRRSQNCVTVYSAERKCGWRASKLPVSRSRSIRVSRYQWGPRWLREEEVFVRGRKRWWFGQRREQLGCQGIADSLRFNCHAEAEEIKASVRRKVSKIDGFVGIVGRGYYGKMDFFLSTKPWMMLV